jgi:hydroxyacylglutathione hydrolase
MISLRTSNGLKIEQILSGRSNVFLLSNNSVNLLIDTSPAYRWKKLINSLDYKGIRNIDYLLLTHSHYDHSDNAALLKQKFRCKVILHRSEEFNLLTGEMSKPQGTTVFTKFLTDHFASLLSKRMQGNPCQPDILIDDNYPLEDFGFTARIIHTPGHSPGSVSVIVDDEIAIAGDTIFGVFKGKVFPPYAADVKSLIISWGKLLETNCNVFLPSHGRARYREQLRREYNKRKTIISEA